MFVLCYTNCYLRWTVPELWRRVWCFGPSLFLSSCIVHSLDLLLPSHTYRVRGVMWFIFHVLQLMAIRCTQGKLCREIYDEATTKIGPSFLILVMMIENACVLILQFNTLISPILWLWNLGWLIDFECM